MGDDIDLPSLYSSVKRQHVPLPTYPFEGKSYWTSRDTLILPAFKVITVGNLSNEASNTISIATIETAIKEIFERFLVQKSIDIGADFASLGGDSLVALLITHEVNKVLNLKLPFSIIDNNLSVRALSEYIANHIENQ